MRLYRCGECAQVFKTEAEVQEHTEKEKHYSSSYNTTDDTIAIVARMRKVDNEYGESEYPWTFSGRWKFGDEVAFSTDESLGWTIRQFFRMGCAEIRVLYIDDAQHLHETTKAKVS
jgi:uncharacterized C2H2 Zn-finger protein